VGGKGEIRDHVLMRVAERIVDTVRRTVEGMTGSERVVTAITVALEQIRSDPLGQLMISRSTVVGQADLPASLVMETLAAELTGIAADDPAAARWVVHVVLSLLYLPIGDAKLEREMVQRFVAPAFKSAR
jgi:hypothetical protein